MRDHGERTAEINAFYKDYTGSTRSLEAYRWEWQQAPQGPALVWVICEASSGRVVGHHGIVPIPLVVRGRAVPGGRTENTIISPPVRPKLFYPAIEKRLLRQALENLSVLLTVFAFGAHAKVRQRLGYQPVGRWVSYLPRLSRVYVAAGLQALERRVHLRLPRPLRGVVAAMVAGAFAVASWRPRSRPGLTAVEVESLMAIAAEYESFWARAREHYDLTIDRSLAFMRWRLVDNPNVAYRTWALRLNGELRGIIIGHERLAGAARVLEVDDVAMADYDDASFGAAVACLIGLEARADGVVISTLAVDTPLHRALQRQFPLQAWLLRRFGARLFDQVMGLDRDGVAGGRPWYLTVLVNEGLDLRVEPTGR